MAYVQVIKGKDLPPKTAWKIRKTWADAFKQGRIQDCQTTDNEIYFILRQNRILALGCLTPVIITFKSNKYNILGIKAIVSLYSRRGYGKLLMNAIYNYLKKRNITGIGFCTRYNTPFYEKCGFNVKKNFIKRFVLKSKGKLHYHHDGDDADVLYLEGKNKVMQKILSSKAKVYVPFFW